MVFCFASLSRRVNDESDDVVTDIHEKEWDEPMEEELENGESRIALTERPSTMDAAARLTFYDEKFKQEFRRLSVLVEATNLVVLWQAWKAAIRL